MRIMIAISLFVAGVCAGSVQAASGLLGIGFETSAPVLAYGSLGRGRPSSVKSDASHQDDSWRGVTAGVAGLRKVEREYRVDGSIRMMVAATVPESDLRLEAHRHRDASADIEKGIAHVNAHVRGLKQTYRGDVPTGGKQIVVFTGITWHPIRVNRRHGEIQYYRWAVIHTLRVRIIKGDTSPLGKWPEHRYFEDPELEAWQLIHDSLDGRRVGEAHMVVWTGGTEPLVKVTQ